MRFLYVVFIVSIAALLWAAYAMARTVRRHGRPPETLSLGEREGETGPVDEAGRGDSGEG